MPMREDHSHPTPFSSLARGAAWWLTLLATLGPLSAGIAFGATTFQLAYAFEASGPASGGTSINLVGNRFQPSATVTIGPVGVGAIITSSTLIKVTSPALEAGKLYPIVVNNGGPASVLPQGWLSDFADVPQASPYHASVETIIRDGITAGCGGGNYCPLASITRAQMPSSCCAPSTAPATCRRPRPERFSATSTWTTSPRTGSSSSTPRESRA